MNEKEDALQATSSKDEQAAAWVVRLSSDQRTSQDDVRFEQWLDEDPGNLKRFEDGLALWDELGALRGNHEAHEALGQLYDADPCDPEEEPWRPSRRAFIGGGVTALAAALAGVLVLPKVLSSGLQVYETAKGEQRRIALADGSSVMLDTATRIHVDLTDAERRITLEHGQAFFDVARDPERPFRVFAGRDEIRALGTAFEVRYEGGSARVILEEGKVAVFRGGAEKPLEPRPSHELAAKRADVVMEPGQEVSLASATVAAEPKVAPVDLSKTNAWRDGELVFDDVSLLSAVTEVNRYGGREIVLADPRLRDLRISGTFHTNRPEAFVEGVTAALPVRLQQADAKRLVLAQI